LEKEADDERKLGKVGLAVLQYNINGRK